MTSVADIKNNKGENKFYTFFKKYFDEIVQSYVMFTIITFLYIYLFYKIWVHDYQGWE